tara:strand:+ start:310 stop:1212 length:903 start_codon:yes stop_codon:yes gene_type:complete
MTEPLKEKQDGSLMSKLLALEAQGEREITKNSIVATSGLDSWNAVRDDSTFQTLSPEQQVEYAKQFDPVTTGLQEMYTKKVERTDAKGIKTMSRITSEEYFDENIDNYPKWNTRQQQRFNVLHQNLVSQEIKEANAAIQKDKRAGKLKKQDAKALVYMNNAFTQVAQFAPILEEIAGDTSKSNPVIEKLYNLVNKPSLYDSQSSYREEYQDVAKTVSEFVNSVNVSKISAGAGIEYEYVNPLTGEPTTRIISGKDPNKIRRKMYSVIMREYEQMAEEVGRARATTIGEEEDFDLDKYEID